MSYNTLHLHYTTSGMTLQIIQILQLGFYYSKFLDLLNLKLIVRKFNITFYVQLLLFFFIFTYDLKMDLFDVKMHISGLGSM